MREGAVVLLPLTQADGKVKPRPAVALRQLPGYGDWLVCGMSTQLHQLVAGFDEQVSVKDSDFGLSGFQTAVVAHKACEKLARILRGRRMVSCALDFGPGYWSWDLSVNEAHYRDLVKTLNSTPNSQ